ncbi:hypothetical protein BD560DRAFT_332018 [Blakeslea trispora]|nr:hypothetical protein BD560DRAFT_332018 [Blakeslea trispora]
MEPSAFEKMKMGAAMGGTVGLCIGFVFGTISLIRFGPGNKTIGSVVRSENRLPFAVNDTKLPILIKQRDSQQRFIYNNLHYPVNHVQ